MKNTQILSMLNEGNIEALKAKLKEEIYMDSLKGKVGAKERYKAMLRFVKYNQFKESKPRFAKPKEIDGKYYFTNGDCLVETTEDIGEIQTEDEEKDGKFLNVKPILEAAGKNETIKTNIRDILGRAKAEGYKFSAKRLNAGTALQGECVIKFREAYIKTVLLDYAYSIIDDGEDAEVEYISPTGGIWITTSIGRAMILPFKYKEGYSGIIINAEMDKGA